MNIALPLLLLVFGGLTFWLLTESYLKWYLKVACISSFCFFIFVFLTSLHSYLGWPADEDDLPEKVLIHWVVIKEPDKITNFDGAIYVLVESAVEQETPWYLKPFGYRAGIQKPRLYGLSYSRSLHEQLEKNVIGRLRKGQPVVGKLTKDGEEGKSKNGKGKSNQKGGGSESQEQEWQFHELLPSDIHNKPSN